MEPASDDEEEMSTNPFIVLDSQRPQKLEEGDKATEEREPDRHAAILENLEISRVSCPDTPAHLQGSEERQKRQVGVISIAKETHFPSSQRDEQMLSLIR